LLLCTTIRHLYRSKRLINIVNRLGHCVTYDFCLEHENALLKAIEGASTSLTPQIITGENNVVFHCEWDNLNQITTNIHGVNMINHTGGIMIQEVKCELDTVQSRNLPIYQRNQTRSFKLDTPASLTPVQIHKKVGPKLPVPPTISHMVFGQTDRKQ